VPIATRVVLTANGHAEVACATSDIGTGTYTIMAQVTAGLLGLALEKVSVRLGGSAPPPTPGGGGVLGRPLVLAGVPPPPRRGAWRAVTDGAGRAAVATCRCRRAGCRVD